MSNKPIPLLEPLRHKLGPIWHISSRDLKQLSFLKRLGFRLLRVLHILIASLSSGQLRLHASSLTFNSLMALVPLLALSLSVLKGLGYGKAFQDQIRQILGGMPEELASFANVILETVENTDFTKLGGMGGLILLIMTLQVLARIEVSFNSIWEVSEVRSWMSRVTNYISIIVVVPLLFIAALTLYAKIKLGVGWVANLGLLRLFPFLAIWAAFAFLYQYMPNTKVKLMPAIISGLAVAITWQVWLRFYILIQPGVTRYNLLYGTLASVPIFLAWLYVTWMIVLTGAEITFAVQRETHYIFEPQAKHADAEARLGIALELTMETADAMCGKSPPITLEDFAGRRDIPSRFVREIAQILESKNILCHTAESPARWVLRRVPQLIKVKEIIDAITHARDHQPTLNIASFSHEVRQMLANLDTALDLHLDGMSLADWQMRIDHQKHKAQEENPPSEQG